MLFAFAGLPGAGKTTIARLLARELRGAYLRIDTIEQALGGAGLAELGPVGYAVAYRLASDQLQLGLSVVADCVNPLRLTRDAWSSVAAAQGALYWLVEVVCSDPQEHRHRIDARQPDIAGHVLPSWSAVRALPYEPTEALDTQRILIDSARVTPQQAVAMILARSGAAA